MNVAELKLIKQLCAPWVERGDISQSAMKEIMELTNAPAKTVDSQLTKPEVLTRKQAAELLHVTNQCLINWQASGKLPVIKLAGTRMIRYNMSDVKALL